MRESKRDYYVRIIADKMQELGYYPSWRQLKHDAAINTREMVEPFGGSEERLEQAVRNEVAIREAKMTAEEKRRQSAASAEEGRRQSVVSTEERKKQSAVSVEWRKQQPVAKQVLSKEELFEKVIKLYGEAGMDLTVENLGRIAPGMNGKDILGKLDISGGWMGLTKKVQDEIRRRNACMEAKNAEQDACMEVENAE